MIDVFVQDYFIDKKYNMFCPSIYNNGQISLLPYGIEEEMLLESCRVYFGYYSKEFVLAVIEDNDIIYVEKLALRIEMMIDRIKTCTNKQIRRELMIDIGSSVQIHCRVCILNDKTNAAPILNMYCLRFQKYAKS